MRGDSMLSMQCRAESANNGSPRLNVDIEFGSGITAIMGQSGSGKTTLLKALAGLLHPDSGRIEFCNEIWFDSSRPVCVPPHLRRTSLVFQSLALFPHLAVWENVAYGIRSATRHERRSLALTWLERAHVVDLADRRPATLSGGEAQRVALARALAASPRLLLLDEPFSALDLDLRIEVGRTLGELLAESPVPTIFVTHDFEDAERLASRLVHLERGHVVDDYALACAASPALRIAKTT